MDITEPIIEVILTDPSEFHCFKIVFPVKPQPDATERVPLEIYLHTTQAIDLFSKLAIKLSDYMHQASAELLRIKGEELKQKLAAK